MFKYNNRINASSLKYIYIYIYIYIYQGRIEWASFTSNDEPEILSK